MTAPVQAPGFLTDPGAEFLATGMTPLAEGEPNPDEGRQLAEAAVALGTAFLVMRHQLAAVLANVRDPRPDQAQAIASGAWKRHLPLWLRLAMPAVQAAMAQRTPGLGEEELRQLALDYCLSLGDYLDTSSAEALQLGFTRQLAARHNEKLAWARSANAYGLSKREMFGYITGVSTNLAAAIIEGRDPMQAVLDDLMLRRADMMGENETWRAMQSAKTMAWSIRYAHGQLPAGAQVEWDTREDEATCASCGPMDHQRVLPGSAFTGPGGAKVACSPLHPGCRCETRLIVPSPIAKSEEPRDWHGRWSARPELAAAEPWDEPAPTPSIIPVRGGVPAPRGQRTGALIPAPRVAAPAPQVPLPMIPPAALPLIPPAQIPPARAPAAPAPEPQSAAAKPKKAKKPKKDKAAKPAGQLIPLPVRPTPPEPEPAPPPFRPGRASAGVVAAAPVAIPFWNENAELLEEVRTDARDDARTIAGRQLGTADIDAIYALAELTPPPAYADRREMITRHIEHGGGSNLSEAYLDYVVYVKPQAAGGAGRELAEQTDAAGIDTHRVRPAQQITYESYAPGDSAGSVSGDYEVVAADYTSTEGAVPGIPGRRRVRLRPVISKALSGFGVEHRSALGKALWREDKHPRGADGEFGAGHAAAAGGLGLSAAAAAALGISGMHTAAVVPAAVVPVAAAGLGALKTLGVVAGIGAAISAAPLAGYGVAAGIIRHKQQGGPWVSIPSFFKPKPKFVEHLSPYGSWEVDDKLDTYSWKWEDLPEYAHDALPISASDEFATHPDFRAGDHLNDGGTRFGLSDSFNYAVHRFTGSEAASLRADVGESGSRSLQAAVAGSPTEGTPRLYRGVLLPPEAANRIAAGDSIQLGLSSFSSKPHIAAGFTSAYDDAPVHQEVIFHLPPGAAAVNLENVSSAGSNEAEWLTGGEYAVEQAEHRIASADGLHKKGSLIFHIHLRQTARLVGGAVALLKFLHRPV